MDVSSSLEHRWRRVAFVLPFIGVVVVGVGCFDAAIPADAEVACTTSGDCGGGFS
jgi:hypothetical protein